MREFTNLKFLAGCAVTLLVLGAPASADTFLFSLTPQQILQAFDTAGVTNCSTTHSTGCGIYDLTFKPVLDNAIITAARTPLMTGDGAWESYIDLNGTSAGVASIEWNPDFLYGDVPADTKVIFITNNTGVTGLYFSNLVPPNSEQALAPWTSADTDPFSLLVSTSDHVHTADNRISWDVTGSAVILNADGSQGGAGKSSNFGFIYSSQDTAIPEPASAA